MRLRLDGLTDDAIRYSDFVTAVDPHNPRFREELFGRGWIGHADPTQDLSGGRRYEVKAELDIEIDSTDPANLTAAEDRVRTVKGLLVREMVRTPMI